MIDFKIKYLIPVDIEKRYTIRENKIKCEIIIIYVFLVFLNL